MDFFGLSSYFIPAILVYSGGKKILGRQSGEPRRKVSSIIFWLCFASLSYYLDLGLGDVRGGGLLGVSVGRFTIQFFSPIGATLVWLFFMLFAAQLHFNFSWLAFITKSLVNVWNKICESCHKVLDGLEKLVIRKSRHTQPIDAYQDATSSAVGNTTGLRDHDQKTYGPTEASYSDFVPHQEDAAADSGAMYREKENAQNRQQTAQAKNTWVNASALTDEILGSSPDWSAKQPTPQVEQTFTPGSSSGASPLLSGETPDSAATSIKTIIERPQQLQTTSTAQPHNNNQAPLENELQQAGQVAFNGQQLATGQMGNQISTPQPEAPQNIEYGFRAEAHAMPELAPAAEAVETQYPFFTAAEKKLLQTFPYPEQHPAQPQAYAEEKKQQTIPGAIIPEAYKDPLLARLLSASEQAAEHQNSMQDTLNSQPGEYTQAGAEEDNDLSWLNGPSPLQERLEALKKKYGADQPPVQPTPEQTATPLTIVTPSVAQQITGQPVVSAIESTGLADQTKPETYQPTAPAPSPANTRQDAAPSVSAPTALRVTAVPGVPQQTPVPPSTLAQQLEKTADPQLIPSSPAQPVQDVLEQHLGGYDQQETEDEYSTSEDRTYIIGMEEQPLLENSIPPATIKPALDPRLCKLPSLDLLEVNSGTADGPPDEVLDEKARSLMACLSDFGIQGELTRIVPGPVVTMFEVKPAPGVRVARIANLNDDLALALKAIAVRVQAPIPGSDTVGIEIPNEQRETVSFRDILDSSPFHESESFLTMALGKDIAGNPVAADLAKMPHLLVAGATGAGKSVCLNSILLSLLYKAKPHELQLLLIDPKRIEMAIYADLPHLVHPVVTEMPLAKNALEWAVAEMDRRYTEIARLGVRNILGYNNKLFEMGPNRPEEFANIEPMPYMVIIIDELADLMLTAAKDVETSIVRLAQLARAAGIHLILATQRPSVDVVTGLIKANFPCRISFQVTSKHDSRTILDTVGAEHLLGKGDMLFKPGGGKFQRLHGAFVSDDEVGRVADFWRGQMPPAYKVDFSSWGEPAAMGGNGGDLIDNVASDPMYAEAVDFVSQQGKASISLIQRRFRIGFNRAARYVEQMEHEGLIGPADGSKPRLILR